MAPGVRKTVCAAAVLAVAGLAGANATPLRLVDGLSALGPPRTLRARLSVGARWRPCDVARDGGEMVCAEPPPRPSGLVALSGRAGAARGRAPSADALHTLGLADLLAAAEGRNTLDPAIQSLQSAARLADRPAPVLADLAAALLLRAERMGNARDVVEAIEVSEEAAEMEAGNPAVLFNRALAMERWGLVDQAAAAWIRCRDADPGSPWADEAARHAAALASLPARPPAAPRDFSRAAVREFTRAWPQQARELGWNRLLAEWGTAVLAGDSAAAATALSRAEAVGRELRARGGDASLAEAVEAIRARAGDQAATAALARAHREFAAGTAANARTEFGAMLLHFGAAARDASPSPVLARWATVWLAAAQLLSRKVAQADSTLSPVLPRIDSVAEPVLAGRAGWARATLALRKGSLEEALDAAHAASALLRRAGETEFSGGAEYVAAEAHVGLGAPVRAYATLHAVLATLKAYRSSPSLANALSSSARNATADGLPRAAAVFQGERVAVTLRTGSPALKAEALLGRAQSLAVLGRLAAADHDVREAEPFFSSVTDLSARQWLAADLLLAHGRRFARSHPARAAAAFDSVVATPGFRAITYRLMQALVGRAQVRLELGRADSAEADLDSTAAIVGRFGANAFRGGNRASLLEGAKQVFDRLVMLRLAAGDTLGALRYLERGRASFAPGRGGGDPGRAWPIPRGSVAVDYALIGDTLLIWTLGGGDVRLTRTVQGRAELARVAERVRSALERMDDGPGLRADLAWLHDRLVRPVAARLGAPGTPLVIVADGEVPADLISALYDGARGRFLIEDHSLRFVPALRDAGRAAPVAAPMRAVVAGDPAFDSTAYPGLLRLPEARAEADSVAALYPGAPVLVDAAVTRAALASAFSRAQVVHFAGHAVFDEGQAERSYLVLAPEPGSRSPGALAAAQLDTLDLGGVRLVVLSACETLRSRGGRAGGFAGFAASLLGAGAGGVVGSSWKVEDRASRTAMIQFHRSYRATGDGAAALQAAQLAMLRSRDPALRGPAAWAGFRYAGH